MKILIFGGSGFIGKNLDNFLSEEFDILVADKEPKGKNNVIRVDISCQNQVRDIINDNDPEIIINLAARTDLKGKDLSEYEVNWKGPLNIHEAISKKEKPPLFIHFSSMLVCKMGVIPPSYNYYCPDTIYGNSKVKSEEVILNKERNYPLIILRPTTVWGRFSEKPYSTFIKIVSTIGWLELSIFDAKRNFCKVDDLCRKIIEICKCKNLIDSKYTGIFYISDNKRQSVNDLAKSIGHETQSKVIRIKTLDIVFNISLLLLSKFGDILSSLNIDFPLNSRRIRNMKTETDLPVDDLAKALLEIKEPL
ncbi:MAG: hypothetical protein CMG62_10895 [Candidatus Marinimicrobia bacterium]|nr:hypothetical protein [Candidatus Neomarinimicrobiota bacterium]|tara:strand:- start:8692 stop:9612 length:921 start_codon:yes stop_codon:yes gene_type:complete